jgi:hypothetical protein
MIHMQAAHFNLTYAWISASRTLTLPMHAYLQVALSCVCGPLDLDLKCGI